MTTLQERIGNERRRLKSVRQKMLAAVEQQSKGAESYVPFYIAVSDYIDASMGRLHKQDVKMGDMIREKVESVDAGVTKALGELDERLAGNQAHLKTLLEAREALKERGVAALEAFEKVARAYSDYITTNMGHHGATTELAGNLFKPEDWEYMAGITDEEMAREGDLFELVENSVPEDVKHIAS